MPNPSKFSSSSQPPACTICHFLPRKRFWRPTNTFSNLLSSISPTTASAPRALLKNNDLQTQTRLTVTAHLANRSLNFTSLCLSKKIREFRNSTMASEGNQNHSSSSLHTAFCSAQPQMCLYWKAKHRKTSKFELTTSREQPAPPACSGIWCSGCVCVMLFVYAQCNRN